MFPVRIQNCHIFVAKSKIFDIFVDFFQSGFKVPRKSHRLCQPAYINDLMKVTCFQEIRVCLPGSRSKTPKSYFERDRVQQTLQIQEIQTGLGQKANACNIQIHRWFWTLGDKKLYKGWQNITFVILRSLDQQSYRFKVKKQFQ